MYSDDVKILEAVVVVIPHRNPHLVTAALHPSLLRNVGKSAVAVVAIQAVKETRICLLQGWQRGAVHTVEIGPPILIEIDHAESAKHGLDLVLTSLGVVAQNKVKPARGCGILELDRALRICGGKRPGGRQRQARTAQQFCELAAGK